MNERRQMKTTINGQILLISLLVGVSAVAVACAGTPTVQSATSLPKPTAAQTVAPAAQLEKVTLGEAPVPVVNYLPFDVARGLDLFKQEGLDVTLSNMGGAEMEDALAAGDVDFVGLYPAIDAQAQGKDLRIVTSLMRIPGSTLVVRSDMKDRIKTVADLRGQTIKMSGSRGTWESKLIEYLVAKAGLSPKDVEILEAGNMFALVSDLEKGNYVAAVTEEPYTTRLIQEGQVYQLVDLATEGDANKYLGGEYLIGLMTSAKMIQKRPQTVQKMTNAIVKALRYIQTHSSAEIVAILPDDVTWQGKVQYAQAIEHYLPAFSKDGMVSEAGIKNWIAVDKAFGSIKPDQQIDVSRLYTNEFVNDVR